MPHAEAEIKKKLASSREDLLDIGLRNSMISFKSSAKSLTIVDELSEQVLDILLRQNKAMSFSAMPENRIKQVLSQKKSDNRESDPEQPQDDKTLDLLRELEGIDWNHVMGGGRESAGIAQRHSDIKVEDGRLSSNWSDGALIIESLK